MALAKRLKQIYLTVDLTVPKWMTAAQARREVRTLINHQSNWMSFGDPDDEEFAVRARKVST